MPSLGDAQKTMVVAIVLSVKDWGLYTSAPSLSPSSIGSSFCGHGEILHFPHVWRRSQRKLFILHEMELHL